jgi:hypothetical protein
MEAPWRLKSDRNPSQRAGLMGFRGNSGSAFAADDPSEIVRSQTWLIDLRVAAPANR